MKITDLISLYAQSPIVSGLRKLVADTDIRRANIEGVTMPSGLAMAWAAMPCSTACSLFILNDADEAGYFYHDLTQMLVGEEHKRGNVLFFPSSYKRKVKYGQKDAGNEILRTEVLAKLSALQQ